MNERTRVLLVGPLPTDGDVVGGTKVSFAALVAALRGERSLDVDVFDISRARVGRGRARRLFDEAATLVRLLARIAVAGQRPHVVLFNTSTGGLLRSGPLVHVAARLRGARVAVRVFGGDLDLAVDRASAPLRVLFERVTRHADLLLLQTHALCERFGAPEGAPDGVRWWPTTRDLGPAPDRKGGPARRFLFVGQLRAEKGVAEAIAGSRALPEGASLTVVGPPMPGFDIGAVGLGPRCTYRGAALPTEIPALLAAHDVLVFPTYHAGEGMAGIVIEAMQLGLPVVATRWRALPELVVDGDNGLLVEPRSAEELGVALARLASEGTLVARLRAGALATGDRFRASAWEPKLVEWLHALAQPRYVRRRSERARRRPAAGSRPGSID